MNEGVELQVSFGFEVPVGDKQPEWELNKGEKKEGDLTPTPLSAQEGEEIKTDYAVETENLMINDGNEYPIVDRSGNLQEGDIIGNESQETSKNGPQMIGGGIWGN